MSSTGPLLIADVPWLMYRGFFALPKSIVDGRERPVNALLGTVNAMLAASEASRPRAARFARREHRIHRAQQRIHRALPSIHDRSGQREERAV